MDVAVNSLQSAFTDLSAFVTLQTVCQDVVRTCLEHQFYPRIIPLSKQNMAMC